MKNKHLKEIYNKMYAQGPSAWYGDGREERELILKMGEPWTLKRVIEIGCGEGDLSHEIYKREVHGLCCVDYSEEAVTKGKIKYPHLPMSTTPYKILPMTWDRIVMQGVLEHLDKPWNELKWIIDNLLIPGGDVITSSPCFLNPRGLVWMALDMVGAVMSKTDLHFINPWELLEFCKEHGYKLRTEYCDNAWAGKDAMIDDLRTRIPLALQDGKISVKGKRIVAFIDWLDQARDWFMDYAGATAVYRIQT